MPVAESEQDDEVSIKRVRREKRRSKEVRRRIQFELRQGSKLGLSTLLDGNFAWVKDPDGNKIEMQVDNFEDPAEADEFMKGKFFEENPIGTDLDAEGWAEKVLRTEKNENEKSKEKVWKEMRQREEIGGRMGLPEGF